MFSSRYSLSWRESNEWPPNWRPFRRIAANLAAIPGTPPLSNQNLRETSLYRGGGTYVGQIGGDSDVNLSQFGGQSDRNAANLAASQES